MAYGYANFNHKALYPATAAECYPALHTIAPSIGAEVVAVLESPRSLPTEAILTALLNDIASFPDHFVLVLDDYHVIDAEPVDDMLVFLLDHLPLDPRGCAISASAGSAGIQ